MAILEIKRAVERRLSQVSPSLPTAYEAVSFTPPSSGMYQRVQYRIDSPDDPTIGDTYFRDRVQAQVFVVDAAGKGVASALARAETIRSTFNKGLYMNENDIRIHVLNTPQISSSTIADSKVIVAVLIDLVAEVGS